MEKYEIFFYSGTLELPLLGLTISCRSKKEYEMFLEKVTQKLNSTKIQYKTQKANQFYLLGTVTPEIFDTISKIKKNIK